MTNLFTKIICLLILLNISFAAKAQSIYKPSGCSASTGPNVSAIVLQSPQNRYHLITMKWAEIETSPDIFTFTNLQNQINTVKASGKKYALAIASGGTGSPAWLFDTFHVPYIDYMFQGTTPYKLPLWWNTIVQQRIAIMVEALGKQFANDSSLALVYVTQMTVNGNEGHLNGINMSNMYNNGFTADNWISAAKLTTRYYTKAFPNKAIAFEVHEIDNSAEIPSTIIKDLYADSTLCQRVGAALWWLSGKTSYQSDLLTFIQNFKGDKYAQFIGKSSETSRFENNNIATAFTQAKLLGVRYIEPWYYEYQNNTINDLMLDFNNWTDTQFSILDTCKTYSTGIIPSFLKNAYSFYPNPANEIITFKTPSNIMITQNALIYNILGIEVKAVKFKSSINISDLNSGIYYIKINDGSNQTMALVKE